MTNRKMELIWYKQEEIICRSDRSSENTEKAKRNLRDYDVKDLINYTDFNFSNYYKRHPIDLRLKSLHY